jgi:hypothetical protein
MNNIKILRGQSLKAGDTKPSLRLKLLEDGDPFNLNGYNVTITIRVTSNNNITVDTSALIENAERGIIEYNWTDGDTDTPSVYEIEVVVFDATTERTFPSRGVETINVEERLS